MIDSPTSRLLWLFGVIALVAVAAASLVPTQWELRTGLHWLVEHFVVYFAVTTVICIAWPRPFVVAASLMILAGALEALQGFTIDRTPDLMTAASGAAGVLGGAIVVWLVICIWNFARFRFYDDGSDGKFDCGGDVDSGLDSEDGVGVASPGTPSSH